MTISALGFGCGTAGGLIAKGDPGEQRRAVARAVDAGVTYFDTAPNYGDGSSEANLGRTIRELDVRNEVQIGTKVGLLEPDVADPDAGLRGILEGSLSRLGLERLDLLFLHSRVRKVADERSISLNGACAVAPAFQRVQREGLVGHTGFTAHGETEAVQELIGRGGYASVQAYFSAVNPSGVHPGISGGDQDFGGLIGAAAAARLGVINIQPLSAGALTGQYHPNARDFVGARGPRFLARGEHLAAVARDFQLDNVYELAFRFALSQPAIACVLVGFSSLEQLDQTLRWCERGPLPVDAMQRIVHLAGTSAN
jgi:L-galactose dehydrogenase/L-glyceraldehyde 3-phosphate reductase